MKPLHGIDDESLMADVALGNQQAFAELVRRFHRRGYQLAWRILHDRAEAEDVMQEQFIKIWHRTSLYNAGRGKVWPWLAKIITHASIDHKRSLKFVVPLENDFDRVDEAPGADRLLEAADIRRTLDGLPARQRAAIALFYMEGFSILEVADMLATTVKSVEALLARGRASLRLEFDAESKALCA